MMSSLLHWLRSRRGAVVNGAGGRKKNTCQLRVEPLEDRTVPSVTFGAATRLGSPAPDVSGSSWGRDIATDTSGNVYLTGSFTGTVDFDPAAVHADNLDILGGYLAHGIFVAKYDASGGFAWARSMGGGSAGNASDIGQALAVDGSGDVYVVGIFASGGTFGAFTPTSGDTFVEKLDAGGTVQWVHSYTNGSAGGPIQDVAVDGTGNVYATCARVVTKLDPNNGATIWSDSLDGEGGIKADAAGNVYITGTFTGSVDFDPGADTHVLTSPKVKGQYVSSGFVEKLTTDGGYVWAKTETGTPNDLALDGAGYVYTGATTDTGMSIAKLAATNGTILWTRSLQEVNKLSFHASYGIAVDGAGNVYSTGLFSDTADFDPGAAVFNLTSVGPTGNALSDVFVSKLDAKGNFVYAGAMGGIADDQGWSIAVDRSGNIYTTGLYNGTADFDPSPNSSYTLTATHREAFISKLTQTKAVIGTFTVDSYSVTSGSSVTLTASNITDANPGATIIQMMFFYFDSNGNKVPLGTGTQTSPGVWTCSIDTTGWASGAYKLYAQALGSDSYFSDPLALELQVQ